MVFGNLIAGNRRRDWPMNIEWLIRLLSSSIIGYFIYWFNNVLSGW